MIEKMSDNKWHQKTKEPINCHKVFKSCCGIDGSIVHVINIHSKCGLCLPSHTTQTWLWLFKHNIQAIPLDGVHMYALHRTCVCTAHSYCNWKWHGKPRIFPMQFSIKCTNTSTMALAFRCAAVERTGYSNSMQKPTITKCFTLHCECEPWKNAVCTTRLPHMECTFS